MRLICVLMIVGVFVALGVLLFASRLIAPVLSIAKAAQEVAKGNFDYPLKIRRKDEIGQLANTFNQMRINLQTLMAKRNQLNLELLKSQLEPHFLLNALGNIKAMAWLSGNQTVARMTGDLAYLLESMLSKNEEFVTLNQELEFTRHYVELQKVRFNDFEFIEKVDEQALNCAVPRILLQPLIENSLKHGFRNNPLGARVTLSVALEGERLCIELADNGTGFGESPEGILSSLFNEGQQEKKKVGLRNIASRLEIYYGQRAGRYEFCLENIQPKGARVVIRIPAEALANGEEKGGRRL